MGFGSGGVQSVIPSYTPSPAAQEDTASWGLRGDGTQKGTGYFGKLAMQDGSGGEMTEFGIGVNIGGKDVEIPSVVPTLSKSEIDHLLAGNDVNDAIIEKAVDHARKRIDAGKNPFWQQGEEVYGVPKE